MTSKQHATKPVSFSWTRRSIADKVRESASRYGSTDQQQLRQLKRTFAKVEAAELFEGLIEPFLTAVSGVDQFQYQALAGTLLLHLKPKCPRPLGAVMMSVLSNFNLSVKQLPWYLVEAFGTKEVLQAVRDLGGRTATEAEARALETVKHWVNNYTPRVQDLTPPSE